GVAGVGARGMALALFSSTSMPPNACPVFSPSPGTLSSTHKLGMYARPLRARLPDRFACSKGGAGKFRVRFGGLRHNGDVRAVASGPKRDCQPDAPARAGDEEGFFSQPRHGLFRVS